MEGVRKQQSRVEALPWPLAKLQPVALGILMNAEKSDFDPPFNTMWKTSDWQRLHFP